MPSKRGVSVIGVSSGSFFSFSLSHFFSVLMNGFAVIILGFISYGLLYTHTASFMPWQWWVTILRDAGAVPYRSHKAHDYHRYHHIDHLRALLVRTHHAHHADYLFTPFDLTRFFFPDSPTTAQFLTPGERVAAIRRIQVNQSGVENKRFKKEQ
jgi:hypothetical protein